MLTAGAGGTLGGVIGAAAGVFFADARAARRDFDADNLIGNVFEVLVALMALAALAAIGFVVGSLAGSLGALAARRHPFVVATAGWIVLLDLLAVPMGARITFWLAETQAPLWVVLGAPAVLVGCLVPAAATAITLRKGRRPQPQPP